MYIRIVLCIICVLGWGMDFLFCTLFFFMFIFWFGGHSGGVTPGLVSIPEVKSSCVFGCTVG
jgi:hypothetical protein